MGVASSRIDILAHALGVLDASQLPAEEGIADALSNAINLAVLFDDARAVELLVMRSFSAPGYKAPHVEALSKSARTAVRMKAFRAFSAIIRTLADVADIRPPGGTARTTG